MGRQMQQNVFDLLLHSLEIYGALYLFYIALWLFLLPSCWALSSAKDLPKKMFPIELEFNNLSLKKLDEMHSEEN
jgi:hypothetical protein